MPKKLRAKTRNKPVRKKTNSEPLDEDIRKLRPRGFFSRMSDEQLVEYARGIINKKGIRGRSGLKKKDGGLCQALRRRKLLDRLEFEKGPRKKRDWASMSDDELLDYAKRSIEEKSVKNRSGLEKEDSGLYNALRKRKLLDSLELEEVRRKKRSWASMSDKELVKYAKGFVEESGIKNGRGLKKEDGGLYEALRRRKLLDRLDFEERLRNWASMSDGELVAYAKGFVEESGIKNRKGLAKEDSGLYTTLLKRKLLNRVFVRIEKNREKQAVQDVFDALKEFSSSH